MKTKLQLAKYGKWVIAVLLLATVLGSEVDFRFVSEDWTLELHIK